MTEVFISLENAPSEWISSIDNGVAVKSCRFPIPKVRRHIVSVAGVDGDIDYTDALGTNYSSIVGTISFVTARGFEEKPSLFRQFHGKRCRIRHSGMEEGRYYSALVEYSDDDTRDVCHGFTLTCYCDPYQYDFEEFSVSGRAEKSFLLEELKRVGDVVVDNGENDSDDIFSDGAVTITPNAETKAIDIVVTATISNSSWEEKTRTIEFDLAPITDGGRLYFFKRNPNEGEGSLGYAPITSTAVQDRDGSDIATVSSRVYFSQINGKNFEVNYINAGTDFRLHCKIVIDYNGSVQERTGKYEARFSISGIYGELLDLRYDSGDMVGYSPILEINDPDGTSKVISGNILNDIKTEKTILLTMYPNRTNFYAVIGESGETYKITWRKGYI